MTDVVRAQAGTGIWPLCIGSTIKSIIDGLENIIILTDEFMPNLMVKDDIGHVMPVMTVMK